MPYARVRRCFDGALLRRWAGRCKLPALSRERRASHRRNTLRRAALARLPACGHAAACTAEPRATAPTVVEWSTSEGCSSCPPADRGLSTLKRRSDVPVATFHVNDWDHPGWQNRFATADGRHRQRALARAAGPYSVDTPPVRLSWRTPSCDCAAATAATASCWPSAARIAGSARQAMRGACRKPRRQGGARAACASIHVTR